MKHNKEESFDRLLKIRTSGRDDVNADVYHYPYEPTPYSVLERLAKSGYIGKRNMLVDYGCGKGRVDFFMSYQTGCKSVGIEYDERLFEGALKNQREAAAAGRTAFLNENAENWKIDEQADRFYFFNPFSVELMKRVMERILESYYEKPREMLMFFYYPSYEYVSCLMTVDEIDFLDEIDCRDLFEGDNDRERILIFEVM